MTDKGPRPTHFEVVYAPAGERAGARGDARIGREEAWIAAASLGALAATLAVAALGAPERHPAAIALLAINAAVLLASLAAEISRRDVRGAGPWIPFALAPLVYDRPLSLAGLIAVRQLVVAVRTVGRHRRGREAIDWLWAHPVELLALGFAGAISIGAVFLMLPAASTSTTGLSLVDALFTATSAACVTGLVVVDTAGALTPFGQGVVIALVQAGGIGVMTLSTLAAVVAGNRLGLARAGAVAASMDTVAPTDAMRLVGIVVKGTLAIEAVGAAVLTAAFLGEMPVHRAIGFGAFHAVSAFCNAGFALWTDNLIPFADDPAVVVTVAVLVVLGGLGFLVLAELGRRAISRSERRRPLSLHARIVLGASGILVVAAAVLFGLLEWHGALDGRDGPAKALSATFMSISARTAGFNSVPTASLEGATILLLLVLMFVGASPGSCGGGIKTTTAAVLLLSVRACVRGRPEVEIGGRTIPPGVVVKAIALTAISACVVLTGLFVLLATQDAPFQSLLFEAVSAFGTVGLSIGATSEMDDAGKLVVVALMYAGRVGPLTLVLLLGAGTPAAAIRRPHEPVALT